MHKRKILGAVMNYKCLWKIEFSPKDAKMRIFTLISFVGSLVMFVLYSFINPNWDELVRIDLNGCGMQNMLPYKLGSPLVLSYITHELIHALFMKAFGAERVKLKFSWTYAYVSCERIFSKMQYIIVLLAPLVILAGVSAVFFVIATESCKWMWYAVLVLNIVAAVGDVYMVKATIQKND
jgi:hypothetical protein